MSTTSPSRQPPDANEPQDVENPDRWVTKRANFLTHANDLRQPVAASLAWLELGYSTAGAAKKLDLSESTTKGYLNDLQDRFGYAVGETRTEFKIDLDLNDLPAQVPQICPECGTEHVLSTLGAKRVYTNRKDSIQAAIENSEATHVCIACGASLIPAPEEATQ